MDTGDIAQTGGAANLLTLAKMFKGTSSTQTTSSNISKPGMDALLQQILGSAQGLSSVASGQRGAGLYNSSTNQLLLNDFMTRAAGELEKQRAGTTTTTRAPAQFGLGDIGTVLGLSAATSLLGPTVKGLAKKSGISGLGDKLANALGLGSGVDPKTLESAIGADSFALPTGAAPLELGAAGTPIMDFAGQSALESMLGIGGGAAGALDFGAMGAGGLLEGFGGAAAAGSELAAGAGLAEGILGGSEIAASIAGAGELAAGAELATAAATAGEVAAGAGIFETIISFLGALFSDERLKTDVQQVGFTNEGQPIYTYKYKNDPVRTHMGVLAQETLEYHPEAVHRHSSGALMVDYDRILGVK